MFAAARWLSIVLLSLASPALAQEVELAPELPAAPATPAPPRPARDAGPTAADAARLTRMLDALAAYSRDQRVVGAILGAGAGLGAAAAGAVIATQNELDSDQVGPVLIGVGAGLTVASVLLAFLDGTAEDIADAYREELPHDRVAAVRTAEAALDELRSDTESARYASGVLLIVAGAGSGVAGALLLQDDSQAGRTISAVGLGTGIGVVGAGIYLLAFGETPVERFIDGYTPVTLAPSVATSAEGGAVVGLAGSF